jgi:hypothetical protein
MRKRKAEQESAKFTTRRCIAWSIVGGNGWNYQKVRS